jgi:hypothetical protein
VRLRWEDAHRLQKKLSPLYFRNSHLK